MTQGFTEGFLVGYNGPESNTVAPNLKSAAEFPKVVEQKIAKEKALGRLAGPFQDPPFKHFHVSPLGVVPKKKIGEFRMIHHLSFPPGTSINDHIPEEFSKVKYQTIESAIAHIKQLGPGCFMSKTDISEAFRIIPIHPTQYCLFGSCWQGQYYFDKCLPMGCSSSCLIFERLSRGLEWAAQTKLAISHIAHVLDDFIILDASYSSCSRQLQSFVNMCADVGVPLAREKTFQPSQVMSFLGYELDSVMMEVRLPLEKLVKCRALIASCLLRQKITLKELQSIIGTLSFACAVVLPGRAFLRRLIDLTIGVAKPFYYIRLTKEVRQDLMTWQRFLEDFNGRSFFLPDRWLLSSTIHLFTDASGSLGYGAVLGSSWFYGEWSPSWKQQNITLLELYPIYLAVEIWGCRLANECLLFHTDNEALVAILNKNTSKDRLVMFLVRRLVLRCLKHNILFQAQHIPGKDNTLADHLSRLQISRFREEAPFAAEEPDQVPPLPTLPV